MHPIGIGRTASHDSLVRSLIAHGRGGRSLALVVRISRGQGETCRENSKAENSGGTKLSVHERQATRTEKQKRQDITPPHRLQTEHSDTNSHTTTPEHKSEAKNRSALENEARSLTFRKKERGLARDDFCASIGANAQAVTKKRRVGKNANTF